jgi:hypothetical protein
MQASWRWWLLFLWLAMLTLTLIDTHQRNHIGAVAAAPSLPLEVQEPVPHRIKQKAQEQELSLPILAYHRLCNGERSALCVETGDFEKQVQWLKEAGYTTITFEQLLKWEMGIGLLPKKPVILTFDDGYLDNYTILSPILQKHRMKATVFLASRFIGTQGYLNWYQVRRMQKLGIEFGSHTLTHANVAKLKSSKQKYEEIALSKKEIEAETGRPVLAFSYPYGFYDDEAVQMVKRAGYQYAVSGHSGLATPRKEALTLKRIVISGYTDLTSFQKKFPK